MTNAPHAPSVNVRRLVVAGLDPEVIELVQATADCECLGVLDPQDVGSPLGVPWLGPDSVWPSVRDRLAGTSAIGVVLAVDVTALREDLASHYGLSTVAGVRARSARVSPSADVDQTVLVQSGVKILAGVSVKFGVKLNHDCAVHHDSVIGRYCVLAPAARLLGSVVLEERCFVGAGAVVLPGRRISYGATVGAGAVVTRDVPAGATVMGVPARAIGREEVTNYRSGVTP